MEKGVANSGGGIAVIACGASLKGVSVQECEATYNGGGVFIDIKGKANSKDGEDKGSLQMDKYTVIKGSLAKEKGGGLYVSGTGVKVIGEGPSGMTCTRINPCLCWHEQW